MAGKLSLPQTFLGGNSMKRVLVILIILAVLIPTFAEELKFSELYKQSVTGLSFTHNLLSLTDKSVSVTGFMAPPLRATGNFFVLTKIPVSLCPFCNSDADWPADILVVYLKAEQSFTQRNRPLVVTGRLEIGSFTDPSTGFVSQVRLVDAEYRDE